jgi:hypothetical protein
MSIKRQQEAFDLEAVYDEKIAPLMTQIIAICQENKLPVFATFLYGQSVGDEGQRDLCTTIQQFPGRNPEMLDRLDDLVRFGLPEDRAVAFMITSKPADQRMG